MSRRKKPVRHVNHERWLVSYADFITLLFAFFVVLYASSQVDKRKVGKLALAIQVAFQEMGVFQASTTQVPVDLSRPMPFSNVQSIENVELNASVGRVTSHPQGTLSGGKENGDLAQLQAELATALAAEIERKEIAMRRDPDGLVISLREAGFFPSGSATPRQESIPTLRRLVASLSRRPYDLRIEGHTDNVPIHNSEFDSNWELSSARATRIARIFLDMKAMPADRLSAAGYAEFHPVASNETSEGRAQNRRVDLVVLPRTRTNFSAPSADSAGGPWRKISDEP